MVWPGKSSSRRAAGGTGASGEPGHRAPPRAPEAEGRAGSGGVGCVPAPSAAARGRSRPGNRRAPTPARATRAWPPRPAMRSLPPPLPGAPVGWAASPASPGSLRREPSGGTGRRGGFVPRGPTARGPVSWRRRHCSGGPASPRACCRALAMRQRGRRARRAPRRAAGQPGCQLPPRPPALTAGVRPSPRPAARRSPASTSPPPRPAPAPPPPPPPPPQEGRREGRREAVGRGGPEPVPGARQEAPAAAGGAIRGPPGSRRAPRPQRLLRPRPRRPGRSLRRGEGSAPAARIPPAPSPTTHRGGQTPFSSPGGCRHLDAPSAKGPGGGDPPEHGDRPWLKRPKTAEENQRHRGAGPPGAEGEGGISRKRRNRSRDRKKKVRGGRLGGRAASREAEAPGGGRWGKGRGGAGETGDAGLRGGRAVLPSAGRAGQERWRRGLRSGRRRTGQGSGRAERAARRLRARRSPPARRRQHLGQTPPEGPAPPGGTFVPPSPWSAPGWGLLAASPGLKEAALGNAALGSGDRSAALLRLSLVDEASLILKWRKASITFHLMNLREAP